MSEPVRLGGILPAVPADSKRRLQAADEQFKKSFGWKWPKLTKEQFEQRRQKMLRGLAGKIDT